MKVFIATPMYGGMCTGQYTSSLFELIVKLNEHGHQAMYSKIYNESLITRARNALVYEFFQTDADALLFIDADHGFVADHVLKMIESGVDLIGAVYPMKNINWERVGIAARAGKENLADYTGFFSANMLRQERLTITLDQPLEVENVATGMMFITRKVFETLAPSCKTYAGAESTGVHNFDKRITEFFATEITDEGILLSEDYYLCKKWQEAGNKVYAAPWVKITHFGAYEFSGNFAQTVILQAELEVAEAEQEQIKAENKEIAEKLSKKKS